MRIVAMRDGEFAASVNGRRDAAQQARRRRAARRGGRQPRRCG